MQKSEKELSKIKEVIIEKEKLLLESRQREITIIKAKNDLAAELEETKGIIELFKKTEESPSNTKKGLSSYTKNTFETKKKSNRDLKYQLGNLKNSKEQIEYLLEDSKLCRTFYIMTTWVCLCVLLFSFFYSLINKKYKT